MYTIGALINYKRDCRRPLVANARRDAAAKWFWTWKAWINRTIWSRSSRKLQQKRKHQNSGFAGKPSEGTKGVLPVNNSGFRRFSKNTKRIGNRNDISIVYRLAASTRIQNRPVIAKFSRRMAKIGDLKNKKNQSDVRIFEDITKARLNFLRMINTDVRVNSAWTREGTIFFEWRQDGLIYIISVL